MEVAIGSLLDRLQGLLSKGFLLGGFVPSFLFLISNASLVYLIFPQQRGYAVLGFSWAVAHPFLAGLIVSLVTFMIGIAIWSLNLWTRQFLEGRYLPYRLQIYLERRQFAIREWLQARKGKYDHDIFDFRKEMDKKILVNGLCEARKRGVENKNKQPVSRDLLDSYKNLTLKRQHWQYISFVEIQRLFDLLKTELNQNSADPGSELDQIHEDSLALLDYGAGYVESLYGKAFDARKQRFPDEIRNLGPTRMANLSGAHREYGARRYNLDIEFFWIRLLKVLREDSEFLPILEEAKTQLDYSVSMTFLIGLTGFVWSLISYFTISGIYSFLCISLAGFLLMDLFYTISLQNYRAFVEVVRSAIDLHRFELLKALHIALPANSNEEKNLWAKIYYWESETSIEYLHEPEQGADEPQGSESTFFNRLKSWIQKI
jgi:hypothetical protein